MIGRAVEKGLASLVARWMLEGQSDAVLDRVLSAGALDAAEVEALRRQTRSKLERVRDEGAPYAAMLGEAAAALLAQAQTSPMATAVRTGGSVVGPVIAQWLRTAATNAESTATAPTSAPTATATPPDDPRHPEAAAPDAPPTSAATCADATSADATSADATSADATSADGAPLPSMEDA